MKRNLKDIRQESGFKTAKEVAQKIDVSEATYGRYEKNQQEIPIANAWKLADLFHCSIDEIVGRETSASPVKESEVQAIYDTLSADNQSFLISLAKLVQERDEVSRLKTKERDKQQQDLDFYLFGLFDHAIKGGQFSDRVLSGSQDDLRDALQEYIISIKLDQRTKAAEDRFKLIEKLLYEANERDIKEREEISDEPEKVRPAYTKSMHKLLHSFERAKDQALEEKAIEDNVYVSKLLALFDETREEDNDDGERSVFYELIHFD